jgi:predicted O-methyltransferase YrrM
MDSLFHFRAYITYWLDAVSRHSLHSPFFYDFYRMVIIPAKRSKGFSDIERLRAAMLKDDTEISVKDLGAGSRHNPSATRKIKDIARTSLSSPLFSRIYTMMINHYQCKHVLELGTSLGINTLYLGREGTFVTTFEGSDEISEIARRNFKKAGMSHIHLVEGDIAKTLPQHLTGSGKVDFALMDANHQFDPTLTYFKLLKGAIHERSVIVVDDIHYHQGMERAWNEMRHDPLVYGSIDLFRAGILFFDPSLNKQHVVLQL